MRAGKVASLAAVIGGVLWLVRALLVWAAGGSGGDVSGVLVVACSVAGFAAIAVALLTAGYSTVATAPMWLRLVVSVALLSLGWVVYVSLAEVCGDGPTVLLSAACALLAGAVGLVHARRQEPVAPARVPAHAAGRRRATR